MFFPRGCSLLYLLGSVTRARRTAPGRPRSDTQSSAAAARGCAPSLRKNRPAAPSSCAASFIRTSALPSCRRSSSPSSSSHRHLYSVFASHYMTSSIRAYFSLPQGLCISIHPLLPLLHRSFSVHGLILLVVFLLSVSSV